MQKEDDSSIFKALSEEEGTEGFDIEAGKSWSYPTNFPLRKYQYNIVQESLFQNTLVSLPTGLGKTFIAAVVMYNFYRWYPCGKIIFMAPTKPLVKQQIEACYNIMAIPQNVTAELTGTNSQNNRREIWDEKRVFFITPQVLQNDLSLIEELSTKIKCLVFDEAHRAKGNYSYCEVIKKLYPKNKCFRVLALSATPGSSLKDVYEVINNLLISHLEIRTEDSQDVAPYAFNRSIETVVVPLGEKLENVKSSYMQLLEKYTRPLMKYKVVTGNFSQLTKGKMFMTMKSFQDKNNGNHKTAAYNEIMRCLNICITLYHGYDLLVRHGLRTFLSFFEGHIEKPLIRGIQEIHDLMQEIRNYLGPIPNIDPYPDGSLPIIPESVKFGHPKYHELEKIIKKHFLLEKNANTRVIIFCEYKESVMEAYTILLRNTPSIRPKYFMGQGAMAQREQMNVIKSFREGVFNTLISTCIGEEGLDVGEVDLIVIFDVNIKSPIRLVQRIGRTGRKREGRVVILVTEGKEQEILKQSLAEKHNLSKKILTSNDLRNSLYKNNPRMIPDDINPSCQKIHMTITVVETPIKKTNSRKKIKLIDENSSCSSNKKNRVKKENKNTREIPTVVAESDDASESKELFEVKKPSKKAKVSKKRKITKSSSESNFKQCDLRNMFTREMKNNNRKTEDNEIIEIIESPVTSPSSTTKNNILMDQLYNEIVNFNIANDGKETKCKLCQNGIFNNCDLKEQNIDEEIDFFENWTEPKLNLSKILKVENLSVFKESLDVRKYNFYNDFDMPECINFLPDSTIQNNCFNEKENIQNTSNNLTPQNKQQNSVNLLKNTLLSANKSLFSDIRFTQIEEVFSEKTDFDDISSEEIVLDSTFLHENKNKYKKKSLNESKVLEYQKTNSENNKINNIYTEDEEQNSLRFFNLESIEDIFKGIDEPLGSSKTITYDFDNKDIIDIDERSNSPILNSNDKIQILKAKALEKSSTTQTKITNKTKFSSIDVRKDSKFNEKNLPDSSSSSEFVNVKRKSIYKTGNSSNSSDFLNINKTEKNKGSGFLKLFESEKKNSSNFTSSISSSSSFEFTTLKKATTETSKKVITEAKSKNENLEISEVDLKDFCDMTIFEDINFSQINKKITEDNSKKETEKSQTMPSPSRDSEEKDQISPIISQFNRTLHPIQKFSITQAVDFINIKKNQTTVDEDISDDDFCFIKSKSKQPLNTPKQSQKNKTFSTSNSNEKKSKQNNSNNLSTKITKKITTKARALIFDSNSDDDFEKPSVKFNSTVWLSKSDPKIGKVNGSYANPKPKISEHKRINLKRRRKKKEKQNCSFLDQEAKQDTDDEVSPDTSENSEDDVLETSFVNDETQNFGNNTMMQAKYLESIKNVIPNRGQFKIPENPSTRMDVYSQYVCTEDNSYLNDSFCDDEIHYLTQKDEMSELELAEMKLKQLKNNKRRKNSGKINTNAKKRRIICISSDESD